jgi:hypothetical protein
LKIKIWGSGGVFYLFRPKGIKMEYFILDESGQRWCSIKGFGIGKTKIESPHFGKLLSILNLDVGKLFT